MTIKNVIFNNPATIVFWEDGTKTVVKAKNEDFDPEKGLAMAIAKKALGNKRDYYNQIRKWVTTYYGDFYANLCDFMQWVDSVINYGKEHQDG